MNIEVYSMFFNEAKMLPFYLNHYEKFCSKIILYDNGSDDESIEIIKAHPKTQLLSFDTNNQLDDHKAMDLYNSCWQSSQADFVIIVAIDEFVHLVDFSGGHDIYECQGFNMWSENFPKTQEEFDLIDLGVPSHWYNKPILFKPKVGPHLSIGNHQSTQSVWKSSCKLLHYHYMGLDYLLERNKLYRDRMSEANLKSGAGSQRLDDSKTIKEYNEVKKCLQKVK